MKEKTKGTPFLRTKGDQMGHHNMCLHKEGDAQSLVWKGPQGSLCTQPTRCRPWNLSQAFTANLKPLLKHH